MRSNGLTAPSYTPIADLDPVVATALLGDLREQGVAAYTKPIESSTTSGFDRPEFRLGVRDRLYVDAAASAQVREFLSTRDPDLLDDNEDLTWAQIVAGYDQPLVEGAASWPEQEELTADDDRGDAAPTSPAQHDGTVILPFTDRRNRSGGPTRRGRDVAPEPVSDEPADDAVQPRSEGFDDADFLASTSKTTEREADGFVPEPPPPLPRLAPHRQVAWLGVLGGPLLLLVVTLFSISLPDWLVSLGVLGFIGGFIILVATMDDDDDGKWGPDDGAVV